MLHGCYMMLKMRHDDGMDLRLSAPRINVYLVFDGLSAGPPLPGPYVKAFLCLLKTSPLLAQLACARFCFSQESRLCRFSCLAGI